MKRLIINADDFGLHEKINQGIIEAYLEGCVTSATIVAGGRAFQDAVVMARQYPNLGIGVHLTLVGLRPVARGDVRSLITEDGSFFSSYTTFVRQYLTGRIELAHVETELRCQLQKVVGSGIPITHLDSHQHIHALPGIAEIIGRLAKDFNVAKVRIPAEPFWFFNTKRWSFGKTLNRTVLTGCTLLAMTRKKYQRLGIRGPENFFGMLTGGQMDQTKLQNIIERLPEGTSEIMVHPGLNNEELNKAYPWNYHWEDELNALKAVETLRLIKKNRIKLISYRDL